MDTPQPEVAAPKPRQPNLLEPYSANRKANIVCALEWAPVGMMHFVEPAMFLMAYPPVLGGRGYVIPLSRLDRYVGAFGAPLPALTEVARKAALRMGLDDTVHTINLVCDVVMANVEGLRSMPNQPPAPH